MAEAEPPRPQATTPHEARALLLEGNARYAANAPRERDFSTGRHSRTLGQAPFATIFSCSDSRVAPELAFDQGPGQLFVVRLAGHVVSREVLASLEYGATILGTSLIVVLGHGNCGAVQATIASLRDGAGQVGHLPALVEAIAPAIEAVVARRGDVEAEAVQANVRHAVHRLMATPLLAERVASGRLGIIGGVYDLATGRVALSER